MLTLEEKQAILDAPDLMINAGLNQIAFHIGNKR